MPQMPEFKEIDEPEERKRLGLDINRKVGMQLDKKWFWKNRVLDCRVRAETGNPAGDDLRERLAALTGVPLVEILAQMKKDKQETEKKAKGAITDYEKEKKFKEVLKRTHVAGAASLSLEKMCKLEEADAQDKSKKNVNKAYTVKPKSPAKRVVMDALRETGKNLNIPNADEARAAAAKLERKLARARMARKEQMDEAAKDEQETEKAFDMQSTGLMSVVLPKYKGDLFSSRDSYFGGTLYLSRMLNSTEKAQWSDPMIAAHNQTQENMTDSLVFSSVDGDATDVGLHELHHVDAGHETDTAAKLYCAISLCNWSRNPANAQRLASEGAIKALMRLSTEHNEEILKFVSAGFRFMSEHAKLAAALIDDGAIRVMSELATVSVDDFVLCNIAVALINLTRCNGRESKAVDEGILGGLTAIIKNTPELGPACSRGIYNLTCVDTPFQFMDKIMHVLSETANAGTPAIKHICAAAVCNLSDMSSIRLKMIESNMLSVLNVLTRSADLRTRRIVAVILQNLASTPKCRVEMISRNCIQTIYNLSSENDPVILRCISVALSKLARDDANPNNSIRIVQEGGAMALCNIAVKFAEVPGIANPTATAFHFLSSKPQTRVNITQEGSIVAISSLLRQSTDLVTLKKGMLSLCNILVEPETHLVVMQQGLLGTLCALTTNDDASIKDLVALAFLNLSMSHESHKHILSSGGVKSIIELSQQDSQDCKRRSAASICNLSEFSNGVQLMVKEGVIPALTELMNHQDESIIKFTCASFCRLSSNTENCDLIANSGVLPMLVQRSIEGDGEVKKFCGSTFSFLSYYESCRSILCKNNVFNALENLSTESDDSSRLRCLAAFGNLSCQEDVQNDLVQRGVVEIIKLLANSYQETSLQCCAKALCNLSCCSEACAKIVNDGGDEVLMMIAMVRSSEIATKTVCMQALGNLIDDNTVINMIEKGVVQTVSNLCKQPDPKSPDPALLKLCISVFNLLSNYDEGKLNIGSKQSQIIALISCYEFADGDSKLLCAHTVANLVLCSSVHKNTLAAGALQILQAGSILENEEASLHCLQAIFMTCVETDSFREDVARSQIPASLVNIASSSYGDRYDMSCKTLASLTYHENSRTFVHAQPEFFSSVIDWVLSTEIPDMAESLAITVYYSTINYPYIDQIDISKLVQTFQVLLVLNEQLVATANGHSPIILTSIVSAIRELSKHEFLVKEIATTTTVGLFIRAIQLVPDDTNMFYDIAAAINTLVQYGNEHRVNLSSSPYINDVVCSLFEKKETLELTVCLLTSFCLDPKSRPAFSDEKVAVLFTSILRRAEEGGYNKLDYDFLYNSVSAIYALSKIPAARDFMMTAGVVKELEKIPIQDNAEMKNNVNRSLKNLASDAAESLEEGTISSLIAMSLEGKKSQLKEDVIPFQESTQQYKSSGPPLFFHTDGDFSIYETFKTVFTPQLGGSAGKGPAAPDPPTMNSEDSDAFKTAEFEKEREAEMSVEEGKSKMSYAKMKIPEELKTTFVLDDNDFKLEEEKLERAAREKEDALASGDISAENQVGDAEGGDYQSVPIPPCPESATPMDTTPTASQKLRKSSSFNKSSNNSASNSAQNSPKVSARGKKSPGYSPTELSPKVSNPKKLAPINSSNESNVKKTKNLNKDSSGSKPNEASKLGLYS